MYRTPFPGIVRAGDNQIQSMHSGDNPKIRAVNGQD
jgi:hypothetical protein